MAAELGDPQVRPAAHRQHRRGRRSARDSWAWRSSRSWSRTRNSRPTTPSRRVAADRFKRRLGLLQRTWRRAGFAQAGGADRVQDHRALYRQTAGMVLSPRMKAFDLDDESPATPRGLRPQPVRPGLPAGPPAGPGRGHVRRGPLQRLGHAPAEPRAGRQRSPSRSTRRSPP